VNDFWMPLWSIPIATALVGWLTNWAAVKMIFHPERFVGVGRFGWQGVIHHRSAKFADGVAEMVTTKLVSAREIAERLDPEEMERLFEDTLAQDAPELVEAAAEILRPGLWAELDAGARLAIIGAVRDRSRDFMRELFDHLQGISDELLDLRHLVFTSLSGRNSGVLARLTLDIARPELRFIEYYGALFGGLIGLVEVLLWATFQNWWILPIAGGLIGMVTNWLALQMIFLPREPRTFFGLVTYQGLFPKRQSEIARDYARIAAEDIFNPRNLMRLISEGKGGRLLAERMVDAISERIDHESQVLRNVLAIEVDGEKIEAVTTLITTRMVTVMPEIMPEVESYLERKLNIADLTRSKLEGLSKREFERILRGVFEEDELLLILIGGALGAGIGLAQASLLLGN
jgi:uncharacterized membrane protein YheB (UPF0754 family)